MIRVSYFMYGLLISFTVANITTEESVISLLLDYRPRRGV